MRLLCLFILIWLISIQVVCYGLAIGNRGLTFFSTLFILIGFLGVYLTLKRIK